MRFLLFLLLVCCCIPVARAQDTLATVQEQVSNDPRLEVIAVLHLLSKRRCSAAEEIKKRDVLEKFGRYRNHTAVLYWRSIQDKYKIYPYEVSVNLLYENNRFTIIRQDQNSFLTKIEERERQEFVRLLNDFSYRSDFIRYYNSIAAQK